LLFTRTKKKFLHAKGQFSVPDEKVDFEAVQDIHKDIQTIFSEIKANRDPSKRNFKGLLFFNDKSLDWGKKKT